MTLSALLLAAACRAGPVRRPVPALPASRLASEALAPGRLLSARGIRKTVAVFGSNRTLSLEAARRKFSEAQANPDDVRALREAQRDLKNARYYEEARRFAALVVKRTGGRVAVVTGGGNGIMEAANRGAQEAGGMSVGFMIKLPSEQAANRYISPGLALEFENFPTRKMALRHGAAALVFFPGGYGTMEELFEALTLMQTRKMERVPVVLFGRKGYWRRVFSFRELEEGGYISPEDLDLFHFAETAEQAWDSVGPSLSAAR